jgi:ABC-type phosphate/phosphonate transport system substrate-binding protein
VARELPTSLTTRLRELFLGMSTDPAGRAILAEGRMMGFVVVRDVDYDPIRTMVRQAEVAGFLAIR